MAKITFAIEYDDIEDSDDIKLYVHARALLLAVEDARGLIRQRLKYGDPEQDPELFLEELRDVLYVEGIQ